MSKINSGEILIKPHVVEIATLAYKALKDTKCDQSIVATGVSGSGKTEAMRFVLYHLVDKCTNNDQDERGFSVEENTLPVLDQIYVTASDPLFEAFGNCMTKWNDNSSSGISIANISVAGDDMTITVSK